MSLNKRYEVYADDDDKFESFIMEMFVQESHNRQQSCPQDPKDIRVTKQDMMYKGFAPFHTAIAIQLIETFNTSHAAHNNERGDGVLVPLSPKLPYLIQCRAMANTFVAAQSAFKISGQKYFNIYRTYRMIKNQHSDIFGYRVMDKYTDNSTNQTVDVVLSSHDSDPAIIIYFDVNIPGRIVSAEEIRAMKAMGYVKEMKNDLISLKNQPKESRDKTKIKNLENRIQSYENYVSKVLNGADVNTIRKEACLDTYDKTYIVPQQLSFHLPRSSSTKISRIKNGRIVVLLNNLERIAQQGSDEFAFYNDKHHGQDAAEIIAKTFRIGP